MDGYVTEELFEDRPSIVIKRNVAFSIIKFMEGKRIILNSFQDITTKCYCKTTDKSGRGLNSWILSPEKFKNRPPQKKTFKRYNLSEDEVLVQWVKVLALHEDDPGLIPCTQYGSWALLDDYRCLFAWRWPSFDLLNLIRFPEHPEHRFRSRIEYI